MQKSNNDSPEGANSNKLKDEDIIKFAEEVLGDPDDTIIEIEDGEALKQENDDVIDLTEVAEMEVKGDDDILDLTEDIEITMDSEDSLVELEDITEESLDTEETLVDLSDSQDDLTLLDDAVLDLDDVVEEISSIEQDIISQDDAAEDDQLTTSADSRQQSEPIELTDADREALESEFEYDESSENLTGVDNLDSLSSDDIEEEILIDFNDDVVEDTSETVDLASDLLDDQTDEPSSVEGPSGKLELTDADRRLLEEELSLEIDENAVDAPDGVELADKVENEIDHPVTDAAEKEDEYDVADIESPTSPEVFEKAEVTSESDSDVDEIVDKVFDQDLAELSPELPENNDDVLNIEDARDLVDTEDGIQTDGDKPDKADILETNDLDDEFNFDFDETNEKTEAESDDIELPPLTPEEELSVEALLAEAETPEESDQPSDNQQETIHDDIETDSVTESIVSGDPEEKQLPTETEMDFGQNDAVDDQDLHKVEDPISIRVKEPAAENHADEDTLLKSVFEKDPEVKEFSSEQLGDAVERAVNKIFAEKIESLLFDAIDRAVTKEIGRLRTLILGDRDPKA